MTQDVLFEKRGSIGLITLNRPKALNALTQDMCVLLRLNLERWARDAGVEAVVIRGAGEKAFCAGGDVISMYNSGKADAPGWEEFFAEEYRMNATIGYYPKPYIALMDGICMGGGVGVSVHGKYRIVTERTMFAMPETGIGLIPDVGGGHFMPRLPGETGMYLGLTGARLAAADCVRLGIGTHFAPSEKIEALIAALAESHISAPGAIEAILANFVGDPGEDKISALREPIDRHFAGGSVAEILASLKTDPGDWAREVVGVLSRMSPTSLKLTYRHLREARGLSLKDALKQEYRIVCHIKRGHDFYEGIRALLIDKDKNPQWRPADVAHVSDADIDAYFQAPPSGDLDFS